MHDNYADSSSAKTNFEHVTASSPNSHESENQYIYFFYYIMYFKTNTYQQIIKRVTSNKSVSQFIKTIYRKQLQKS